MSVRPAARRPRRDTGDDRTVFFRREIIMATAREQLVEFLDKKVIDREREGLRTRRRRATQTFLSFLRFRNRIPTATRIRRGTGKTQGGVHSRTTMSRYKCIIDASQTCRSGAGEALAGISAANHSPVPCRHHELLQDPCQDSPGVSARESQEGRSRPYRVAFA
jgi:hypothetical protein